jgi:hypothetical protein
MAAPAGEQRCRDAARAFVLADGELADLEGAPAAFENVSGELADGEG